MKVWIIVAAALILLGGLVFTGVMFSLDWDFSRLSTVKIETNEYTVDEDYNEIFVNTSTADVVILPSADGSSYVKCKERVNEKHSVTVKDGALVIEKTDSRKWYEYIEIGGSSTAVTVYLPEDVKCKLTVKASTGKVSVGETLGFESIDLSISTGKIECKASADGLVKIKATTGKVKLSDISVGAIAVTTGTGDVEISRVNCGGDINVKVDTGDVSLDDVTCKNLTSDGSTGDLSLKKVFATEKYTVNRGTGDVALEACDASELEITTSTGNVRGSLLTAKVFAVKTDTGRVDVPTSVNGGLCKITTDTGNVKIGINN